MKQKARQKTKRAVPWVLSVFLCISTINLNGIKAFATSEELMAQAEARKSLPVETNQIENWPEGPQIGAESAILIEANTGVILYAKDIHKKSYPASTTKIMTCLLAAENTKLDDMITFSNNAVFSIERGSSNIGMDAGESITVEEALYGIMVGSANEVSNAIGEHIAGGPEEFAEMMNKRAEELGCSNTHFVNAHGLHDDNHYTSAYDLATIARAFFQNEMLSKIANTRKYEFHATSTQPDEFILRNKHKLISGEIPYDDIMGGKTGYTDTARQTLVTCAQRNGMKLICVIMKEESPEQFHDTVKLFDYGFNNFQLANVSEYETEYAIDSPSFFQTGIDVFGSSSPILSLNSDSYVILPKTVDFSDLESTISYDTDVKNAVAEIEYTYHGAYMGRATIDYAVNDQPTYDFDHMIAEEGGGEIPEAQALEESEKTIFVNIKNVIIAVILIAAVLVVFVFVYDYFRNYSFSRKKRYRNRRKKGRKGRSASDRLTF